LARVPPGSQAPREPTTARDLAGSGRLPTRQQCPFSTSIGDGHETVGLPARTVPARPSLSTGTSVVSRKSKNNRRKVVIAKKRERERLQPIGYRRPPQPLGVIAWVCSDPACVEGIHHSRTLGAGDSVPERGTPAAANDGRSSDSSDCYSEGATSGHGTEPRR
jgi:hypothetical protein